MVSLTASLSATRGKTMRERQKQAKDQRQKVADIIKDQIECDISARGAGPIVLKVIPSFNFFYLRFLAWQQNELAAEVAKDFIIPKHLDLENEVALRAEVQKRYAKFLDWQAERCVKLGPPRKIGPKDVDLSRFTIDAPMCAMLEDDYENPGQWIRNMLTGGMPHTGQLEAKRKKNFVVEKLMITSSRLNVNGQFVTGNDQVKLKWSKGSLSIYGLAIPDAIMMGLKGKKVQDIVQHPWFTHPMTITAADRARSGGQDGVALNLTDTAMPIPAHW